jgi:hypothetical protein
MAIEMKKGNIYILQSKGRVKLIKPEIYTDKNGDKHDFDRWEVKLLDNHCGYPKGICYVWKRDLAEILPE